MWCKSSAFYISHFHFADWLTKRRGERIRKLCRSRVATVDGHKGDELKLIGFGLFSPAVSSSSEGQIKCESLLQCSRQISVQARQLNTIDLSCYHHIVCSSVLCVCLTGLFVWFAAFVSVSIPFFLLTIFTGIETRSSNSMKTLTSNVLFMIWFLNHQKVNFYI